MNRRHFLTTTVSAASPLAAIAASPPAATAPGTNGRMGITLWSYQIRWRNRGKLPPQEGWKDALAVLDHCHDLGAGCLQIGVQDWTTDFAGRVREKRESHGIALEGQIGLPRKDGDLPRFEAELKAAREAGATTLRSVCLGSRRYEAFHNPEEWENFVRSSRAALERVEPVLAKHRVRLAVENHKDWRTDEHLALLEHLSSEWIGVTFDFGNNYALLEDPHEVAEALSPHIFSTHVKDMDLAACAKGFLLSEVPLGKGRIDIARIMKACAAEHPDVWFNLEMITRDPLVVPVLEESYWETLGDIGAPDLARTLRTAASGDPDLLPHSGDRDLSAQLEWEEDHVRQCFDYARKELGFS